MASATLQGWNITTTAYQNIQRILLTYAQVTGTHAGLRAGIHLAVAPNPGSEATVHYQLLTPAAASVEIFNLAGRRVAVAQAPTPQAVGPHRVPLTGLALAPGLWCCCAPAPSRHKCSRTSANAVSRSVYRIKNDELKT